MGRRLAPQGQGRDRTRAVVSVGGRGRQLGTPPSGLEPPAVTKCVAERKDIVPNAPWMKWRHSAAAVEWNFLTNP